jgi:gamma-glutamyltranspeptidase/glutathione hydrolase
MVAAANPLAVETGLRVLKAGGSAVDAAVAIQAVLGLVEPQSSGLGGGAFMVFYDAKTHKVTAYDGREVAPAGASPRQFLGEDGKPLPFAKAVVGGIASGVPGAVAMLELAQKEHGQLPWKMLFGPAHQLASQGFIVSPRLAGMIASNTPQAKGDDARAYFTKPDGTPYVAGDRLINPAYAATLDTIATQGAKGLLTGPVAEQIVARLHAGTLPSTITLADLAAYKPKKTEGLCRPYRAYVVCTPQAPSGGPVVLEALGLLEHTDIAKRNAQDPQGWFQIAQASRLAYADRDYFEGDPAFVPQQAGLLAPAYLAQRAKLMGESIAPVTHGTPKGALAMGVDHTIEPGGTSHFVIVDPQGNAVSMTTTVESIFGNGRMVGGFFLNNQLTDFSFSPVAEDGTPAANGLAPGKRPRSSMSPAIILTPKGKLVGAVGSPGGGAIIAYVIKASVALLDWKMTPQAAVSLPNLVAHGNAFSADPFAPPIMDALAAKGLVLQTSRGEASGLHAIMVRPAAQGGGYIGGADPRREGVARGF